MDFGAKILAKTGYTESQAVGDKLILEVLDRAKQFPYKNYFDKNKDLIIIKQVHGSGVNYYITEHGDNTKLWDLLDTRTRTFGNRYFVSEREFNLYLHHEGGQFSRLMQLWIYPDPETGIPVAKESDTNGAYRKFAVLQHIFNQIILEEKQAMEDAIEAQKSKLKERDGEIGAALEKTFRN
ncbi:MAG: hypothetical protein KGH49_00190 [Candidatus Micrarchaeota archaeon]|nr:hypothetical protein [Candidatus Micrarchaeota archaeon]